MNFTDLSVIDIGVLFGKDLVLETVLNEYLILEKCRVFLGHSKKTLVPPIVNLEDYRDLAILQIFCSESHSHRWHCTSTCVADQVQFGTRLVRVYLLFRQLQTSVKIGCSLKFICFSILIGHVNDVAECSGVRTIILDF